MCACVCCVCMYACVVCVSVCVYLRGLDAAIRAIKALLFSHMTPQLNQQEVLDESFIDEMRANLIDVFMWLVVHG